MLALWILILTVACGYSAEGRIYEGDINGDGIPDSIHSNRNYGNGGGTYLLALSSAKGETKHVIDGGTTDYVLERPANGSDEKWIRLWYYWHMSAVDGYLSYCQIEDNKTTYGKILISTGDGGTELGNALYRAFRSNGTILKMKHIDNYELPKELRP